jgi:hypothetical protein
VEFIGEIGEEEKNDFLGNALALLFPIDWPETFWPGHDRILRDRNPGHRFCQWFGAGNYRTRADGLYRGESGRGLLRGRQNLLDQPAEVPGEFEARFGVGRMAVNTPPFMKNFWPTAKKRAVMIFDLFGRLPDGVRVPCWI